MASNIIDYQNILDIVNKRQATREFTNEPIEPHILQTLNTICRTFKPFDGVRAELITSNVSELFALIFGIKTIKNPQAVIVFINKLNHRFEMGYIGEFILLSATTFGLDSCWTASSFNKKKIKRLDAITISDDEELLCVCPLGYAVDKTIRPKDRLPIETIAPKFSLFPSWAKSAVSAARLAPSALNIQPCRYEMKELDLKITLSTNDTKRLIWNIDKRQIDLGIAAAHINIVANLNGIKGKIVKSTDNLSATFPIEPI